MTKIALLGSAAFIALTALAFPAAAMPSDREDHLWPDKSTGGAETHLDGGPSHGPKKRDKEPAKPYSIISKHGSSPKCGIKDVSTYDSAGNAITIKRHLCK